MKVLWLCSIPLPSISEKYKTKKFNIGSWIEGMKNVLLNQENIQLGYVFPSSELRNLRDEVEGIKIYSFCVNSNLEKSYKSIIDDFKPDIVHIFGTENPYAYTFARVFGSPQKTVVNIQGVVYAIVRHYASGIPAKIQNKYTIRDIIKHNNIQTQKKIFAKCAIYEEKLIRHADNFIGRTEFDKAIISQFNANARYYLCNETLRDVFYKMQGKWNVANCEKYSLFMSQAQYPVKGIHFMIEALAILKAKYPGIRLYIAGTKIRIVPETLKDYWLQNSYARYVWNLIKRNYLQQNVVFMGSLTADEMAEQFLRANIFISASTIENESNSLSEAKMVGTPIVASYVGGVINRIKHGQDGFLYQHDAPYMLAFYIDTIFSNQKLAMQLSTEGVRDAAELFSIDKNQKRILDIYNEIERA